jgi:hypothetical protein
MQDRQEKKPTVSPVVREKCIERAREAMQDWKIWGRYRAVLYLTKGIGLLIVGVILIVLIQGTECPARLGPAGQKPFQEGFAAGIALGMFLLVLLFLGGMCVVKGIKALRCDPTDHILVEYHDALVNLMHAEESRLSSETDTVPLQDSMSVSEPNA